MFVFPVNGTFCPVCFVQPAPHACGSQQSTGGSRGARRGPGHRFGKIHSCFRNLPGSVSPLWATAPAFKTETPAWPSPIIVLSAGGVGSSSITLTTMCTDISPPVISLVASRCHHSASNSQEGQLVSWGSQTRDFFPCCGLGWGV